MAVIGAVALAAFALCGLCDAAEQFFSLPPMAPPELYGTVLIDRTSTKNKVKPVVFQHWIHRKGSTCRVCHFELQFEFKAGTTEITEEMNRQGFFCGACHNGQDVFGHTPGNCERCHTGDITSGSEKFADFQKKLPRATYGNQINWVRSIGVTHPVFSIFRSERPFMFKETLHLTPDIGVGFIPPAVFPHAPHGRLLDCSNCHPDIFNLKVKGTLHFRMDYILEGKFCGVCHMTVAFPLDDCKRCHPGINQDMR